MTRPLLYICAPWRNRTGESMHGVRLAVRVGIDRGWCPVFAPWLFSCTDDAAGGLVLDDDKPEHRQVIYELNDALLEKCAGLVVIGSVVSEGMARELKQWGELDQGPEFHGPVAIEPAPG